MTAAVAVTEAGRARETAMTMDAAPGTVVEMPRGHGNAWGHGNGNGHGSGTGNGSGNGKGGRG